MDKIASFRAYLEKKPEDRFAMYSLAFELAKTGQRAEALEAFEALLRVHPTSGAGWLQYGMVFHGDEDYAEAIAVWKRGLAALDGATDSEARRSRAELEDAIDEASDWL